MYGKVWATDMSLVLLLVQSYQFLQTVTKTLFPKLDSNGNPVLDDDGNPIWLARVISDGLVSLGGEISPDGKTFYGWEPLAFNESGVPYGDPNSPRIPTSNDVDRTGDGKPDSWPEGWYNPNLKRTYGQAHLDKALPTQILNHFL